MAIKIGTNFSYEGERFLDERQSMIRSISELRDWDILIPNGFEVYVEGDWYIYNPEVNEDTITGNWHKRIDYEYERDSKIKEDIDKAKEDIQEIQENLGMNSISFKTITNKTADDGDGLYEVGHNIQPYFTWTFNYGSKINPNNIQTIIYKNGVEVKRTKETKYVDDLISSDTSYEIKSTVDGTNYISETVNYKFLYKKYYITQNAASYSYIKYKSEWCDDDISLSLREITFDEDHPYLYFCIPTVTLTRRIHSEDIRLYIGGMEDSNIQIQAHPFDTKYLNNKSYWMIKVINPHVDSLLVEFIDLKKL